MPSVLVLGAHGMLGRAWIALLERQGVTHRGVDRVELNLSDEMAIHRWVDSGVDWVVNCAGWTSVDEAEGHEDVACDVNGRAVGVLAARCKEVGASLLHYSTDYVFDGVNGEPYAVTRARAPINAYGRSKALGEELLESSGADYLLIRTSWMYAPWGKNFVLTIGDLARKRSSIRVVNDQRGRPSNAQHVAQVSWQLAGREARGTFHVTDGGECSWYELATVIAEAVNSDCKVQPCASADYPRRATRPPYSVLDIHGTEQIVGPMPHWKDQVRGLFSALSAMP